jgi:DNA replication protein DnaC
MSPVRDEIRALLAELKMPGALEAIDGILREVDSGGVTAAEAIRRLLAAQIDLRNRRRLQELGFVERQENVVLLGPPGVGKTHSAVSLAIAAAQRGRRVYYGTLVDLIASLEEARAAGQLTHRLAVLTHPAVRVVDEIGCLPINPLGAILFFQLMNRRYGRAATSLTFNKGFEEWGGVFGDEVMAAALIDRILHHCHLVNIRGNSWRMRHHVELSRALTPADPSASGSPGERRKSCTADAH